MAGARPGNDAINVWLWVVPAVSAWVGLHDPVLAADPVEQGREVYGEFCVNCHGRDMISPGSVSFDLRKFPKDDFERFRNSVLNGKGPAMPPWRDKISDDDVTDLWAYVRSGG
jgi:mono/diheme cytochrome c family protein